MPTREIRPAALTLMRVMAGDYADRYVGEILLPSLYKAARSDSPAVVDVRDALEDPYRCLEAIFGHYAFSRRGKERGELSDLAVQALRRTCREEAFEKFLALPDASLLWTSYQEVCLEHHRKPMEQLNRGVLAGLAELAQEIYREDGVGSIASWIVKGVLRTDHLEPQFLRMVDIRGVGPKLSSLFVRDVAFLFNLEESIDPADRLYVQPIDKWIRLVAPYVIDEIEGVDVADWILAGKMAKYTRRAGVSGIRFNMGTSFFGAREARSVEGFGAAVEAL